MIWVYLLLVSLILILLSALFSGLTLGLMILNLTELKRKASLGDKDAMIIYSVRKNGSLLLTTLLMGNVAVNSALSIFIGSVTFGWLAIVIATAIIFVIGEITPHAMFSRFSLRLTARFIPFVKVSIFIFYPITYPISILLDKLLGKELSVVYSKNEIIKLIEEHEASDDSDIDEEEERILKGALQYSERYVRDVMTPKSIVSSFDISEKMTSWVISQIVSSGYSRFPVYEGDITNVVGILYAKKILGKALVNKKVEDFTIKPIIVIRENETLDDVLEKFIETKKHMFIVKNENEKYTGVLTIEDVIEEIINQEIVDEDDLYDNLRIVAKERELSA